MNSGSKKSAAAAVPAIGIDLGTTYSCVAVLRQGRVEVIKDPQYNDTTIPSHVHFSREGNILVGRAAKDMVHKDLEPKVFDAKRLIGRKFNDKEVQDDMKLWPFTVVRGKDDTPLIQLRNETVRPEVISAHILSHLKRTAETRLNLPGQIKNAVITVPAYFNDAQRQATKDAGEIAGLNVLRIINEPTAAAIAYNLDNNDTGERNVLVFDLGGGTFDISVLKIRKGDITVMAVGGDTHLGGEDFDNELVYFCLREFEKKNNVGLLNNVGRDERNLILHRIREQCEQMKRVLSQSSHVTVKVYRINARHDLHVEISRKAFEELCEVRFGKCIAEVEKTLKEAGLDKSKVNEVVLAGGSTRIPKVQKMLSDFFSGKKPKHTQSSDEVVAIGAARLASLLSSPRNEETSLADVIPHSLGVEARIGGVIGQMSTMIPKNTSIPCSRTMRYHTASDYQTVLGVKIFEGEDPVTKKNRLLGEFILGGFPARLASEESADVTMEMDLNGILTVTAVGVNVATKKSITIGSHKGCMEKAEKEKLVALFAKKEKTLDSYFSKLSTGDDEDNRSDNDDDF